jgi:hypothetical protein
MAEVLSLLNSGYKKGQCAIRIEGGQQGSPQIGLFDVFGFKALAGTEELAATLQSRCIITPMTRAVRKVNLFMNEQQAQKLRNQLLKYRLLNLGQANEDMITDFLSENEGFRNARVIELFISLIQVAPTQEVKQRLVELMKQITQSRLDAEQASIEARIFEAILKSAEKVDGGKISTQVITDFFNDGLNEKDQATSRFIGRKVAALGFEKCRVGGKGQAGFYYNADLINRLKARYFPTTSKSTSETSETPETSVSMGKQSLTGYLGTEVSEVNSTVTEPPKTADFPLKTVVSDVSEQTEVKPENPLCCDCKKETVFSHQDDAKVRWYKCPDGHYTSQKPKPSTFETADEENPKPFAQSTAKIVIVKHSKTAEPCSVGCGLAPEWELKDPDIEKPYLFCNKCFQDTKKGYETNG